MEIVAENTKEKNFLFVLPTSSFLFTSHGPHLHRLRVYAFTRLRP